MADVLTEELRYSSEISMDGVIMMTPHKVILKNGEDYIVQSEALIAFQPGDNPDELPAYGPELAKAVWTAEIVDAYAAKIAPVEEEPS